MTRTAADYAGAVALAGDQAVTGQVGPFKPSVLVPVFVTLSGTWAGTVRLLRSVDAGVTKHAVKVLDVDMATWTTNGARDVWEESNPAAELYLDFVLSSGIATYRLGH